MSVCKRLFEAQADFRVEPCFDYRTFLFSLVEEQISEKSPATKSSDEKLFMLIAIEGVSSGEAAHILGLDQSYIERWIIKALN